MVRFHILGNKRKSGLQVLCNQKMPMYLQEIVELLIGTYC